jgi:restriction endonuclease-like protein
MSVNLRRVLAEHAEEYANAESIPHCLSYGEDAAVCFFPYNAGLRHGNFLDSSYKAIMAKPEWRRRLAKVHTSGRHSLPVTERGRWMELDTCTSSDALLMNIFCFPGAMRNRRLLALLDAEPNTAPIFGYRARVPLANGRFDRTEVDMRLGNVLIEAKLTESDFQSAKKRTLLGYRDFVEVFDGQELPQGGDSYLCYQLLRNVLAAYASQSSFCVLVDSRRRDLAELWYAVMKCVKPIQLRTKLRICAWQELAGLTAPKLREFLRAKYGIGCEV